MMPTARVLTVDRLGVGGRQLKGLLLFDENRDVVHATRAKPPDVQTKVLV